MKASLALRWNVRAARLTNLRSRKGSATSWWQLLHGVQAINTSKRGTIVEESGLIGNRNLLLSDKPDRFDVVMTPGQAHAAPELPYPSIGTLDAVTERMEELASQLTALKQYPTANRLAFGLTLFHASFQRNEVLETLAEVFPELTRELRNSADFVFQISHPARMVMADLLLEIHFLQKWYFAQQRVDVGPQSGPMDAFSANLDLDISTGISSDRKLSADDAATIFPRLMEGAKRILELST